MTNAIEGLSNKSKIAIVTSSELTKTQQILTLKSSGLTIEEAKNAVETAAMAASQTGATATTSGLGLAFQGLGIKIKEATTSALEFLTTNPIGWALLAGLAVLIVVKAYDKYQEHLQKIIDKGQEAQNSIKSYTDELSNTKSSIDDAVDSYERLADGVDLLTNKNISLSDDEYKEFIDTNNTLGEMFPELISGLDDEGNMILNLGDNAETAKSKLDELYESQQKLVANEIKDELPDVFKGIYQEEKDNLDELFLEKSKVDESFVSNELDNLFGNSDTVANIQSLIQQYGDIQKTMDAGIDLKNEFEDFDFSFSGEATEQTILELTAIQDLVKELTGEKVEIQTSVDANGIKNAKLDLNSLSSNDILDVYSYITQGLDGSNKELFDSNIITNALVNSFDEGIEKSKDKINANYKKQVSSILKVLESDEDYYANNKQLIDALVTNFDYSSVAKEIEKNYDGDIVSYLNKNLLSGFDNLSSEDSKKVQDYYNELLSIDSVDTLSKNIETINNAVDQISKLTNVDKDTILNSFGLDGYEDLNQRIEESIKKVAKNDDELSLLKKTTSNLTIEQSKLWLSSSKGCETATQLINAYNQALRQSALDYTVSFDPSTAFTVMDTALKEQSDQGYLTNETLDTLKSTYGDLSDILTYTANGVQLNSEKMMDLTEQTAQAALVNTQLKETIAVKEREKEVKALNRVIYSQIQSNKTDKDGKKIGEQLANARNKGSDALREYISANKDLLGSTYDTIDASITKIEQLNDEINGYDALEQSIYSSISALADYKKAKETANSSDDYNYVQSEIATNETAFKNGWTQTDEFKAWMDYIGEFNEKVSYSDEEIQKYMDRAKRYYTEDLSGLFNFLDDANEKSNGMISKLADGSFNINVDDLGKLAEAMDMSVSSVTDIMLAMKDAGGFNIDFSNISESLISGLKNLPDDAVEARTKLDQYREAIQKLKDEGYDDPELEAQFDATFSELNPEIEVTLKLSELSEDELKDKVNNVLSDINTNLKGFDSDIKINVDSTDVDDLDKQISELSNYRDSLDLNVDGNLEYYENANAIILQAVKNKQELEKPAVMDVDVSTLQDDVQNAIALVQSYVNTKNLLEQQTAMGIDTSDAENDLANIKKEIDALPSGVTTKLKIDADVGTADFDKQIAALDLSKFTKSSDIQVGIKDNTKDGIKKIKNSISNETAKIQVKANTTNLYSSIDSYLKNKTFNINVNARTSGIRSGNGSYLLGTTGGFAHAQGKNIGAKSSSHALTGELGQELVVRGDRWFTVGDNGAEFADIQKGDIIFNAEQTKSLLGNGHIGTRGKAYASGTGTQKVSGSAPSRSNRYGSSKSSNKSSSKSSSSSNSSDEAKEFLEIIDWVEIKIQRCEEEIERLDKVATNTYTNWTNRTSKLNSEISATIDEIKWATAGYQEYMDKANSIGLSDAYKQKVISGEINIEDITDEDLKTKIDDFKTWYEKAINLSDSIEELNQKLSELQKTKFDNIVKQFEDNESIFTNIIDQIDAAIDYAEAKGRIVSKSYYSEQSKQEEQNNKLLQQQRNEMLKSLSEAVSSGRITEGSEAWYEMYNSIQNTNKAIIESNTKLQEFKNSIRQVDWDLFDTLQDKISNVSDELEFMSGLLDDQTLTDGKLDKGLNDYGIAQIGQYASAYNIYMAQSQKYADEIKKINSEISKDPANQDLIKRKEDLVEAQQEAIKSAQEERQSMIDLAREGYDAVLNSLQDLIDKRKEALNSEKDLYEYSKSISEKTQNIADLKKQQTVYENDNSQESIKRIQQIKVELDKAEQDLKETEYEKAISDTQDMLDDLYQDYSDKIDEKFEQTNLIIEEYIGITNANAESINNTIQNLASDVGYQFQTEFSKIWDGSTGLNSIVSTFSSDFKNHSISTLSALANIKTNLDNMYAIANKEAEKENAAISNNNSSGVSVAQNSTSNTNTTPTPQPQSNPAPQTSSGNGNPEVGDAVTFVNGKYTSDSYGGGRSGNQCLGGTVYITKINPHGSRPYHISRTSRFGEHNLGWVTLSQLSGYKNGLRYATKNELAFTQEEGSELIRTPDGALLTEVSPGTTIFNNDMTQQLWKFAKNPNDYINDIGLSNVPYSNNNSNSNISVDIQNITLPNVTNPDEFSKYLVSAIQKDKNVYGAIESKFIYPMIGKSSKKANKY